MERKARNDVLRNAHHKAVKAWEQERDCAKRERRRAQWTKPKLGALEKPIPRPKKPEDVSESEEDNTEDNGGDETDMEID